MQNMPIAIFRGDDTDALGYQTIVGTIRTDLDLTGCKAVFKYLSFSVEFNPIPEDKKLTVIIPASETKKFPPGLGYASLRVYDSEGKLCTFSNRIMVFVATKTPMFGNAEFEVDFNVRPELEPLKIFVGPNPDNFDEYSGFLEKVIDRASADKYGLAILLDAIDSDLGADDGVAATPVAVKAAYAAIIKKLTDDYYTRGETDEAIDRVAAYYITSDAVGHPFPTHASLVNAQTYYSGGTVRVPTRNDYAIVLADETQGGSEYRYIYAVAEGQTTGSWQPQYPVEGVMTVDQSVTKDSQNPVSGGGVWSAIWGALAALPTGFSSLYDWVVDRLSSKLDKSGGTADNLLICGTSKAIKFNDDLLYIYSKINDAWVAQNIWDLRTSQDGVVAFLSDIYTAVQQIAPEWVSGTAYTAKMLVTYNGVVYRCKADTVSPHTATPNVDTTHWEAKPISDLFVPLTGGTMTGRLDIEHLNSTGEVYFLAFAAGDIPLTLLLGFDGSRYFFFQNSAKIYLPVDDGTIALTAGTGHDGNLAELDANGNPTDSGISARDLLTIVTLSDSTETMASILARLNAINTAHKHVFFDCSGIDVNPRLYLCTIMIDADANAVRIYDQVTGKLYIGPYDAAETIGEVFARAVDAYYSIVVTANTLDGATVTGQTVTLREGADASAPVYDTAAYNGSPVTFVVPKGFQYFVEITPGLAGHFSPSTATGVANAPVSVTLTYQDTSNITDYIGLKGFLDTVAADSSLTTDAERIAFAQAALIPAGGGAKEIPDTFTNTAGTVYDNPMVVYAIDYVKGGDGQMHLAALVQRKWCSSYDMPFDAPEGVECDSETETAAEDGVYYYGLALGATSKTAANLTLLDLSPGDALPYADYETIYKSSLRDTTRNSLQYGDNNWSRSAYRQNLNSSAAPGAWWSPTHVGDTAPSNLNSVRGYMAGCSAALLAAAKPVYVKTWPNYITDGANRLDTVYETLDTFFLPSGVEVYANVNMDGVFPVEGPLSEYWKIRTGFENPTTASTSTRIMYRELPVGSTANRSAAGVRLRSAVRGNLNGVWYVGTSGQVGSNGYASAASASVPACAIY